jgi:hypothetical protein
MSLYPPEPPSVHPQRVSGDARRSEGAAPLVLIELNPRLVVDTSVDDDQPLEVLTFGTVREVCPKCQQAGLKLVLRQSCVRVAHLFCADCASCYDAQYADGAPALTI